jgi:microsomal dipeptidase-like Zn-dependent dipeptidase
MIADLHCHFPMHLVGGEEVHPHDHVRHWWERFGDRVKGDGFELAAKFFNDQALCDDWRVSLDGLEAGRAGLVCSVLYWPFSEFELESLEQAQPDAGAFDLLVRQLDNVEQTLADADSERQRHIVVRREADMDDPRIRFVHCVEGGFHLGPDKDAVADQIRQLADRGVFYITLAHLFFRQVAADAPAIPSLTDEQYNSVFHQPRQGLTELGRAAIRAMCDSRVVVDISHMRQDVVKETLAELDTLDPHKAIPVIASHIGAATAGPPDHAYNLTPDVMRAIRDRGGVIGIIAAQHLLGETKSVEESKALLCKHIDAVRDEVGGHGCTAFGTDMDGFIKPMICGLNTAKDLTHLQDWIHESYPDDAEAILHGNAERVVREVLRQRALA